LGNYFPKQKKGTVLKLRLIECIQTVPNFLQNLIKTPNFPSKNTKKWAKTSVFKPFSSQKTAVFHQKIP